MNRINFSFDEESKTINYQSEGSILANDFNT